MKKILNWIKTKIQNFKRKKTKSDLTSATSILDNLGSVDYKELPINQLLEYQQLLSVLENQFEQLSIDLQLGFITPEIHYLRLCEWQNRFEEYRNNYISRLEVDFA